MVMFVLPEFALVVISALAEKFSLVPEFDAAQRGAMKALHDEIEKQLYTEKKKVGIKDIQIVWSEMTTDLVLTCLDDFSKNRFLVLIREIITEARTKPGDKKEKR